MAQTGAASPVSKINTIADTKVKGRTIINKTIGDEVVNTIICSGTLVDVDEEAHKDKTSTATQIRYKHLLLHPITPHRI